MLYKEKRRVKFPSFSLKPSLRHSNLSVLVHNWDKNHPLYTSNQVFDKVLPDFAGMNVYISPRDKNFSLA